MLIDEVQYAPELFPAIKLLVDKNPEPGSVWLTGSQSFPLMKGVSESLAGRVAILNLLGFSARESDQRQLAVPPFIPDADATALRGASAVETTLDAAYRRIWRGAFPALVTGQVHDRDLFYRSYVQTYLQRDVRDLVNVGDLDLFMRYLKAVAATPPAAAATEQLHHGQPSASTPEAAAALLNRILLGVSVGRVCVRPVHELS